MKKNEPKGDIFSLDHQYNLFLHRMDIDKRKMPPLQRKMMKEAFFGACGQLLILFRDDVGALPENQAIEKMESLLNQVGDFWLRKKGQQN